MGKYCIDHNGKRVRVPERGPSWKMRSMEREWTPKERLGLAQKKSEVQRPKARITLPREPWATKEDV